MALLPPFDGSFSEKRTGSQFLRGYMFSGLALQRKRRGCQAHTRISYDKSLAGYPHTHLPLRNDGMLQPHTSGIVTSLPRLGAEDFWYFYHFLLSDIGLEFFQDSYR